MFVTALDQTIMSTAIPTITSQLHSASGYTWIGGAYLLSKAAVMPIWAKLSDIWGRKPIMLASILLFFVSSIDCAIAHTMTALILGRAIQGIGGGGLQQLTIIIITDIFSLRQRSLYLALVEVMWAVAGGIGPVLGGLLASSSWRWIFWLNLPITGVAFLLTILFLDVHNPRTPFVIGLLAIDWLGIFSILGFTLLLLLGLNLGGVTYPWSSPTVIFLLAASPLFLVLFILTEHKHTKHPIIPLHTLFSGPAARSNAAAYTTVFAHGIVLLGLEYYIPLYLQSARAASPALSGLLTLPLVLTNALTAVAGGVFIHRTGAYLSILRGGASVMALGAGLLVLLNNTTSTATLVGLQVLVGAGVGACLQPPELAVQARVPQDAVAAAMAALGFVRNVATALSVVGGGAAFANGMAVREGALVRAGVDAGVARELAGAEAAAANVERVGELLRGEEAMLQGVVREAYAGALRNVWILYACVAGVAVVATLFVERSVLSDEHTETKTGIWSEERAGNGESG